MANGGFGDLSNVCAKGEAKGATDKGVTDTEIHIGTVTDKGFTGRSGLNKEMVDAANAFATWCNEKGGILGRKIVVDDLDAKLTDYNGVVTQACDTDFALVGGGAVFDDADNGGREACGLPIATRSTRLSRALFSSFQLAIKSALVTSILRSRSRVTVLADASGVMPEI